MTEDRFTRTLFGVSRGLEREELAELEDFLRNAWEAQYGRPPSTLSADLERMQPIFKTGASGKRIRDLVGSLPRLARRPPVVSDEVFLAVDDRRGLVTPEGRVVLEQLSLLRDQGEQVLSRDAMLHANALVAVTYGDWQREWLARQLGQTSLRPGTYGVVLLLLFNGSTTRETALRLPAEAESERALAAVVSPVIDAFAKRLGGQEMSDREASRLRSNWRVTEARKHLFERVRVDDSDGDAHIWVDDEERTLSLLAGRLAARKDLDVTTLHLALQEAAATYEASRPSLAAWGLAHGRANHTRHVLDQLEERFIADRAAP